jgi:NAD(P)-dependent dehydrogenase (short-subunit alcohol dehydrogenase family)
VREGDAEHARTGSVDPHEFRGPRGRRAALPAAAVDLPRVYDTAKAALAQLTRSLAFEWARYGVNVNAIAAGQFATRMSAQLHETEAGTAWLAERIPMRRTGDPEELGRLVVMLAGDQLPFLTGQVIALDGGETLW